MKETFYQLPHIKLCALEHTPQKTQSQQIPNDDETSEEVVLALHGWLDNANSFLPMMNYNKSLRVIAVEWPGHGNSDHRGPDASYQLLDYVYDLYTLIKQENWKKVHVVGHSLGAIVASVFVGTFPELVDKLILIEALGPITAQSNETKSQLKKSIVSRYQSQIKAPSNRAYSSVEKAIAARLMVSDFNEDIATMLVTRSIKKVDGGYQWRSDSRLKHLSPIRMVESQSLDIISDISNSTLLVLGDNGFQSLRENLAKRTASIKSINMLSFAGGHHVHMEEPKLVWKAIEQHITS